MQECYQAALFSHAFSLCMLREERNGIWFLSTHRPQDWRWFLSPRYLTSHLKQLTSCHLLLTCMLHIWHAEHREDGEGEILCLELNHQGPLGVMNFFLD
jgi:hypothetical protein